MMTAPELIKRAENYLNGTLELNLQADTEIFRKEVMPYLIDTAKMMSNHKREWVTDSEGKWRHVVFDGDKIFIDGGEVCSKE